MGKLISTAKHPITVQYNGQKIIVSPGEKLNIRKVELLPAELPAGIVLIKD